MKIVGNLYFFNKIKENWNDSLHPLQKFKKFQKTFVGIRKITCLFKRILIKYRVCDFKPKKFGYNP